MTDLLESVTHAVRDHIQPAFSADGILVEVLGIEGGCVLLKLSGDGLLAPASVRAVFVGIEEELRRRVPGVEYVAMNSERGEMLKG